MHPAIEWIEDTIGLTYGTQINILSSLIIILGVWLVRKLILKVALLKVENLSTQYKWQKTTYYIAMGIGVILVGRVWFQGVTSLVTFLGIVSAGLAIALKDPLLNLAGWAFILWRRPFELGDRISIADYSGDVVDQGAFLVTLMEIGGWVDADQNTGRIVYVPNGLVFNSAVANYTKGWFEFIWDEIPITITFESNWKRAEDILRGIVRGHGKFMRAKAEQKFKESARKYMIIRSDLQTRVFITIVENGVQLTVRYLCEPRRRRLYRHLLYEKVLEEFARCEDVKFAYPTTRFVPKSPGGAE